MFCMFFNLSTHKAILTMLGMAKWSCPGQYLKYSSHVLDLFHFSFTYCSVSHPSAHTVVASAFFSIHFCLLYQSLLRSALFSIFYSVFSYTCWAPNFFCTYLPYIFCSMFVVSNKLKELICDIPLSSFIQSLRQSSLV